MKEKKERRKERRKEGRKERRKEERKDRRKEGRKERKERRKEGVECNKEKHSLCLALSVTKRLQELNWISIEQKQHNQRLAMLCIQNQLYMG